MRQLPIGVVVLSLALHVLVALALSRLAWHVSEPIANAPRTIVWLAAPLPLSPPESPPAESPPAQSAPVVRADLAVADAPPRSADADRAAPTEQSTRSDSAETGAAQPAASRPPSPVDLAEARQRAIDTVLKDREVESSYLSFTFPGTIGEERAFDTAERQRRTEAGLQAPLTAFDSPSKGRAGLREKTNLGENIRWISDDCYQKTGTGNLFILPAAQWLFAVPMTTCARPKPRGDLFASAKPTYLMDPGEREAAAERSERMERLRRPTTGAVMPREK